MRLGSGGCELGHGLGSLRDGVLCKLTRKEKANGSLDLAGRKSALLVVARKLRGFKSKALEDVVDERVQNRHASLGDASVGVNLLQHLVDVRRVGFHSSLLVALGTSFLGCCLDGLNALLSGCGRSFGHFANL